ncbi:uncharacterized protein MEPE_06318 [Melanopsichium pennsylvanicum]|uniref:Transcription factor domain-containing protein n=1 Tax=Melanopsichium pennsylvanicum TaxID=63383 RepID=A0AAJ4XU77_9BASI|nr:uncharacterized protein MEPE_06318 [Melanopsichium pennsylvanicum]
MQLLPAEEDEASGSNPRTIAAAIAREPDALRSEPMLTKLFLLHINRALIRTAGARVESELLRHPEVYDLAYAYHPFLSLIVSRALFLAGVEDGKQNKMLNNAILLSGVRLKESQGSSMAPVHHGQSPEIIELKCRMTTALQSTKLSGLESSALHIYAQVTMLLAWHELTQGFVRRASAWGTFAWGLLFKMQELKPHEDHYECVVNGYGSRVLETHSNAH